MASDDQNYNNDLDSTIIKPMPGGRRPRARAEQQRPIIDQAPPGRAARGAPSLNRPSRGRHQGINNLLDSAGTLLSLVGQLRESISQPDIDSLRGHVEEEIKLFESTTREYGADAQTVSTASYMLCTVLDETVLGTPWGNESIWGEQTLLAKLHREAWGGEKFFSILENLLQDPARYIDLLELCYLCLSMGFQGKYRVESQGDRKLLSVEESLFYTIRDIRGDFERDLSPHWRGVQDQRNLLVKYIPFWVLGTVLAVLLVIIFIGFRFGLNQSSKPAFVHLSSIGRDVEILPAVRHVEREQAPVLRPVVPSYPGLSELLAKEISAGQLRVDDQLDKSLLVIQGDGLFLSGSASVDDRRNELMSRIGEAIGQVPGRVLVVGHTDDVPIRSLRFRSNWDLSRQRAVSVAQLLAAASGVPERYATEGRADTDPLVPNDSAANRSINRRVEITVMRGTDDL